MDNRPYEHKMVTPMKETKERKAKEVSFAIGPNGNQYNVKGKKINEFLAVFGLKSRNQALSEGWRFK